MSRRDLYTISSQLQHRSFHVYGSNLIFDLPRCIRIPLNKIQVSSGRVICVKPALESVSIKYQDSLQSYFQKK